MYQSNENAKRSLMLLFGDWYAPRIEYNAKCGARATRFGWVPTRASRYFLNLGSAAETNDDGRSVAINPRLTDPRVARCNQTYRARCRRSVFSYVGWTMPRCLNQAFKTTLHSIVAHSIIHLICLTIKLSSHLLIFIPVFFLSFIL